MSNSDYAKSLAEANLAEKGYVHPTNNNYSNTPQYMGYNTDYFTQTYDTYATVNTEESDNTNLDQVQSNNVQSNNVQSNGQQPHKSTLIICPVCDVKASYKCGCCLGDLMCKNGHVWYMYKNGQIALGDPHEDE